ncbi:DUF421 domain-containing protein [Agriterribacter humi]|jgi:uncharacterized membrane protein YcaP (DUF421 family)|uniref:DUF421 domain-containing protein n=1 Tax=Agriterribacter humi TaxID=1104781 RepID=UPI001264D63F|nr:YetF domain-containing protein [Agriterribacter humi]
MHIPLLQFNGFFEIDWQSLLLGTEKWIFLVEVVIRSFVMFLTILFSLRILGKQSVTQLSIFELGVIIGLGSAAGDPMFYKDVGLLPGMMVFLVVVSMYRLVTYIINRGEKIERFLEGEPIYLVEDGRLNCSNFEKELIAHDELFAQLRINSVSHLGQVNLAILEINGSISLYYYPDEEVRWGLPVLPHLCTQKLKQLPPNYSFACSFCGQVESLAQPENNHLCPSCKRDEWVKAINNKRIV